ncbi:MAG: hypothetical protein WAU91_11280 [Desulfatitalea sp.]
MKRTTISILMITVMTLCLVGMAAAAEVSQGKCISYDKGRKLIAIEEYDLNFSKEFPYGRPNGTQSEYDVATAEIGIVPEIGDILRVAYDVKGTTKVALRVMNVSKQDLRKK